MFGHLRPQHLDFQLHRAVEVQRTDGLAAGQEIAITGFGKFSVAHRDARQGVNPATGEPMHIAASKAPRFAAGARLKEAVKR